MVRLLNRLFEREDIPNGKGETYMERWVILSLFGYRLYLHHFLRNDDVRDLHDHPNGFITFVFRGGYLEEYVAARAPNGFLYQEETRLKHVSAPSLRYLPANHTHRVMVGNGKTAWSLVLMFPAFRAWSFFHRDSLSKTWTSVFSAVYQTLTKWKWSKWPEDDVWEWHGPHGIRGMVLKEEDGTYEASVNGFGPDPILSEEGELGTREEAQRWVILTAIATAEDLLDLLMSPEEFQ